MPDERWPRRAVVTMKFDLLSETPITATDEALTDWLAGRLGRTTDNGPYVIGAVGTTAEQWIEFGPTWWEDGAVYRDPVEPCPYKVFTDEGRFAFGCSGLTGHAGSHTIPEGRWQG